MTVGCRGLGDSDPSVTAESSASRREMAPSQVTESQRKDSQQKDSDPSWDKNVRTERAPQAGSWEYSQRTTFSGGRTRTHARLLTQLRTFHLQVSEPGIPSPHNRDPGFSLLLGRVSTLPLPYSGRRAWVVGGGDRYGRDVP